MTIEEIKASAAEVAAALAAGLTDDVRQRFIALRAELFRRGVFDPVLARFDTATVPRASNEEIAAELAKLAESL